MNTIYPSLSTHVAEHFQETRGSYNAFQKEEKFKTGFTWVILLVHTSIIVCMKGIVIYMYSKK